MDPLATPHPGPPDDESRRELERIEGILERGARPLIVRNFLVVAAFLLLALAAGFNASHPAQWLLAMSLMLAAYSAGKHTLARLRTRAGNIRAGKSSSAPAELRDVKLVQISLCLLLGLSVVFGVAKSSSERDVFIHLTAIAALVLSVWALSIALKAIEKTPPDHLRRDGAENALLASLLLLLLAGTYCVALTFAPR